MFAFRLGHFSAFFFLTSETTKKHQGAGIDTYEISAVEVTFPSHSFGKLRSNPSQGAAEECQPDAIVLVPS